MLKIGVFGIGYLGKIYLKCIGLVQDSYELVGFFDFNLEVVVVVVEVYNIIVFFDVESLIEVVDVVDVVIFIIIYFVLVK